MGQYFIIVNITKKEFIHPHKFGDGLKLLEFGSSGFGTMFGLALLLRQSTGNGGGDFQPDPTMFEWYKRVKEDVRTAPPDERGDKQRTVTYIEESYGAKEWTAYTEKHVKEFLGRWSGDKITIVGDYDDSGLYSLAQGYDDETGDKTEGGFRDISYEVLELMLMDRFTLTQFQEQPLSFSLKDAPEHIKEIIGVKPGGR